MGTALFIIGLLASLVCIVLLFISLIRKKPYKRWGLGMIISLMVFIIGIATLPSGESPTLPPVTPNEPSTPTKTATLSASEQDYINTITSQCTIVGNAFTEVGNLLQDYQFGNDEWTIHVAVQLVIIRSAYDEAMDIEPPTSMADIHYKYVQGMNHFNTMTDLLTKGIDQLDTGLIEQAVSEANAGTEYIYEAAAMMNDFKKDKE